MQGVWRTVVVSIGYSVMLRVDVGKNEVEALAQQKQNGLTDKRTVNFDNYGMTAGIKLIFQGSS